MGLSEFREAFAVVPSVAILSFHSHHVLRRKTVPVTALACTIFFFTKTTQFNILNLLCFYTFRPGETAGASVTCPTMPAHHSKQFPGQRGR